VYGKLIGMMNGAYLTVDEHRDLFARAGYSDIQVFEDRARGWLCAIGARPSRLSDESESAGGTIDSPLPG
jgi:hypothetical protein